MSRERRRCGGGRLGPLAAVMIWVLTGAAMGQGSEGFLPDPITTAELGEYAQRLELSDQQRIALEGLHDGYKEQFRELRATDIQKFQERMWELNSAGGLPSRKVLEEMFDDLERLQRRIAALDRSLFDRAVPLLTEPQQSRLQRVRLARERRRMTLNQLMPFSGNPVDLSAMVLDLDVSREQRQVVDTSLIGYEQRLTKMLTEQQESMLKLWLDMLDGIEAAGITEEMMDDPEQMAAVQEQMMGVYMHVMQRQLEQIKDVTKLNRDTLRTIKPLLDVEAADRLERRFLRDAYPEIGYQMHDPNVLRMALRLDDLADEQRSTLQAEAAAWDLRRGQIIGEAIEQAEATRKEQMSAMFGDVASDWEAMEARAEGFRQRYQELVEQGRTLVKTLLTEEQWAALQKTTITDAHGNHMTIMGEYVPTEVETVTVEDAEDESTLYQRWGHDQFLAPQIDDRELEVYLRLLNVTDDQRAVAEMLHEEYESKFGELQTGVIADVSRAGSSIWQQEDEDSPYRFNLRAVDEQAAARKRARAAIDGLDTDLFANIDAAVLREDQKPKLERVRLMRRRLGCASALMYSGGGQMTDLTEIIGRVLSPEEIAAIDSQLLDYERTLTETLEQAYDIAQRIEQGNYQWQAQMQYDADGSVINQPDPESYQKLIGSAYEAMNELVRQTHALNDETMETIGEVLPATSVDALKLAIRRRSFPHIYQDHLSVERHLERAMELADLSDDQRRKLGDLSAGYLPTYYDLCDQLAELEQNQTPWGGEWTEEQMRRYQEMQARQAQLNFDRSELCLRTARRLKTILSEDQLKRIGRLPEPQSERVWW